MDPQDEIVYSLKVSEDGKEITLKISAPQSISNQEFIVALDYYLADLIRSVSSYSETPQLH